MTIKEAGVLMVGFHGTEPDEHIESMIRDAGVGGVILFRRNLHTPAQVRELTAALQALSMQATGLPLLIAMDYEADTTPRLDSGLTPLPPAFLHRRHGVPSDTALMHEFAARELQALGVNLNLAPCLDVNTNRGNPVIGARSFGETAEEVERYGLAALQGMGRTGMLACAKHFPGHGDTVLDSHFGLASVPHDRDRLERTELSPFRQAIRHGVDAIMTAHVMFPAIDPHGVPATLSSRVLTDLLRHELEFQGVILTDCLEMAAIAERLGVGGGAVKAIEAGADMVLVSHSPHRQHEALTCLAAATADGGLRGDRLEEALARVRAMRLRSAAAAPALSCLQQPEALSLSEKIYRRALICLDPTRPLSTGRPVRIVNFSDRRWAPIEQVALGARPYPAPTLAGTLSAGGFAVTERILAPDAGTDDIRLALEGIQPADQVLVLTHDACLHPCQRQAIQDIDPGQLWILSGNLPFDLDLLESAQARLGTCSNRPWALALLLERLGVDVPTDFASCATATPMA
jgi:beta-N-acetylhexosaminidase